MGPGGEGSGYDVQGLRVSSTTSSFRSFGLTIASRRDLMTQAAVKALALGVAVSQFWDDRNYYFGKKTSNESVRRHLDRFHREEYVRHVEVDHWVNRLPSHVKLAKEEAKASEAENPRIKFSMEELYRHLVNLIVGDDLVKRCLYSQTQC